MFKTNGIILNSKEFCSHSKGRVNFAPEVVPCLPKEVLMQILLGRTHTGPVRTNQLKQDDILFIHLEAWHFGTFHLNRDGKRDYRNGNASLPLLIPS